VVALVFPPAAQIGMNAVAIRERPAQRIVVFEVALEDRERLAEDSQGFLPFAGEDAHVETVLSQLPDYGLRIVPGGPDDEDGLGHLSSFSGGELLSQTSFGQ